MDFFRIEISFEYILFLTFFVSFLVSYLSIPSIVRVAKEKKLFDKPDCRKSHNGKIPSLGGVAIFAGLTVAAGSFIDYSRHTSLLHTPSLQYILVACIIMFFIGLKDDILIISPMKKLMGQMIAALILIIPGNLDFSNLHGFLGIYDISFVPGLLLTLFVIIVITNSFNLIDGIDGLATSIGMLSTAFFGLWFFLSGNEEYCLLSAAMLGALSGFFKFNIFGGKYKIFMGDTGSLILGLMMAVQVILFNEKNIDLSAFSVKSAPAVSFAVLIIPLFDTTRVFLLRMLRGKSPFSADNNHIHHCLLKIGFTHGQATILIVFANLCFIALAFLLQNIGIVWLMIVILSVATILSLYIAYLVRKQKCQSLDL